MSALKKNQPTTRMIDYVELCLFFQINREFEGLFFGIIVVKSIIQLILEHLCKNEFCQPCCRLKKCRIFSRIFKPLVYIEQTYLWIQMTKPSLNFIKTNFVQGAFGNSFRNHRNYFEVWVLKPILSANWAESALPKWATE